MSVLWEDVLDFYCLTVEMMSVWENMCQFLLSNCWNDVSVWGDCAQFLLSNCWNDDSVWEDVLNFYCPTVEMMSVCEKMCLVSIV